MGVKQNARNRNSKSSSRLASAFRAKQQRSNNNDADAAIASDGNKVQRTDDESNIASNASDNGSSRGESNGGSIVGGSGNYRSGRGRDTGSDGDTDNRTGAGAGIDNRNSDGESAGTRLDAQDTIRVEKKPRKKRITLAEKAEARAAEQNIDVETATAQIRAERKSNRKPRYVGSVDDEVEPGVTASVILIGSLIEGGTELLAMAANKPYFQLQKQESFELSDAILKVLDTFPKSVRKNFDRMFAQYYPWWNLAKVCAKITYPRYMLYQAEKEFPQHEVPLYADNNVSQNAS